MDFWKANRKFTIALGFELSMIAGLFLGFLSGSEFIAGATLILSAFGAANVTEKTLVKP